MISAIVTFPASIAMAMLTSKVMPWYVIPILGFFLGIGISQAFN